MRTLLKQCLAWALVFAACGALAQPAERDARAMLKAMSDHVASLQSIRLAFDSDIEIITPQLEKIQFTNSGAVLMVRPNKIRAHRMGGFSDVELIYDGKVMSIHGKHVNGYAQIAPSGGFSLIAAAEAVRGRPASPVSYAGVAPGNAGGPVNRVGVR